MASKNPWEIDPKGNARLAVYILFGMSACVVKK